MTDARVLAIGGPSHAGKSSVATLLSREWRAQLIATDSLARHPGRPWTAQGLNVIDYFGEHDTEWLLADAIEHYAGMQHGIEATLASALISLQESALEARIILEGSAVLPHVPISAPAELRCVYLTASAQVLRARMSAAIAGTTMSSPLGRASAHFIDRAIAFDREMRTRAAMAGTPVIESRDVASGARAIRAALGDFLG